jgi:hypothetical protein
MSLVKQTTKCRKKAFRKYLIDFPFFFLSSRANVLKAFVADVCALMSNIRESETLWHSIPRKQKKKQQLRHSGWQWVVSVKRYLMTQLADKTTHWWRKQKWPKEQLSESFASWHFMFCIKTFSRRATAATRKSKNPSTVKFVELRIDFLSTHILEGFVHASVLLWRSFLTAKPSARANLDAPWNRLTPATMRNQISRQLHHQ